MTAPTTDHISGERDELSVTRIASAHSRVGNALALGLMCALGLGSLTWYYAHALLRPTHVKERAQADAIRRAEGDVPLPSLGRIDAPQEPPSPAQRTLPEIPLAEIPLAESSQPSAPSAAPPPKSPEQLALERRLSGAVFEAEGPLAAKRTPTAEALPEVATASVPDVSDSDLSTLLRPSISTAVRAQMLPAQRLLLPKGAFIDCTLETAIDSTLPGMTTCVMATDAFGVDGAVVLLERGTKLVGETRGQIVQGAARIFVIWTEARTPTGYGVPHDSPRAAELGRSGLSGAVNRHFWQRFGAAMLVSVIDGAVQSAAQSARGGSAVIVNPSGSQDVLTGILKNTIGIPPTVTKRNGDRVQVLVARDLDFRSVYELRSVNR